MSNRKERIPEAIQVIPEEKFRKGPKTPWMNPIPKIIDALPKQKRDSKKQSKNDLMQYQESLEEIGRQRSYHQNKIESCIQDLFKEKLCNEHKGTISYWNYAKYAVCVAIKHELEEVINDEKFDTYREIQEILEES